ncbi:MAG: phosphoribosylglycinamide formyltransferase [Edaphobacter sp.]|uniref:phosphoribosylglycinamide formyltransferase n=1 Tax=Edaphobacter sp. TaxID=1934404 RepID=UPI00238F1B4E|nr:phosphoribosylglycinamide formyltransferase [Edaphobacter sp.]MDE1176945.1 phosphoribosylglycinamide formyltransferase [Edaphobacter sp.]
MHRLGILLSGRGSNFLAIHRAIAEGRIPNTEIAVVLSNKPDAPGLDAARSLGLKALAIPQEGKGPEARAAHDARMIAALQEAGIDLVCLAGYMRIITPAFVAAFPNRILNVHPSLLPAFPGLDAQHQAFDYGAKVAGCTVHFVDEAVDHGVIILQKTVPVLDEDTAETLSARILVEEHIAYAEAIARVLSGEYRIEGRHFLKQAGTF